MKRLPSLRSPEPIKIRLGPLRPHCWRQHGCRERERITAPRYVRYGWSDNPDGANLYNREGITGFTFPDRPITTTMKPIYPCSCLAACPCFFQVAPVDLAAAFRSSCSLPHNRITTR